MVWQPFPFGNVRQPPACLAQIGRFIIGLPTGLAEDQICAFGRLGPALYLLFEGASAMLRVVSGDSPTPGRGESPWIVGAAIGAPTNPFRINAFPRRRVPAFPLCIPDLSAPPAPIHFMPLPPGCRGATLCVFGPQGPRGRSHNKPPDRAGGWRTFPNGWGALAAFSGTSHRAGRGPNLCFRASWGRFMPSI